MENSFKSNISEIKSIFSKAIKPKCFSCQLFIEDFRFIFCSQHPFHRDCLRCSICNKQLTPGDHIIVDRLIYCKINCLPKEELEEAGDDILNIAERSIHQSVHLTDKCARCLREVCGDFIVSSDRIWHRKCLYCDLCKRILTPSNHIFISNFNYCREHCFSSKYFNRKNIYDFENPSLSTLRSNPTYTESSSSGEYNHFEDISKDIQRIKKHKKRKNSQHRKRVHHKKDNSEIPLL